MNLLMIHCDALHADVLEHRRWPALQTPAIDRLASEGLAFPNTFVQYPTCVPSRASFITGLYPQQLGVFHHGYRIPEQVATLADRLNAVGYESLAFGRTHGQDKGFRRLPNRTGAAAYGTGKLGFHPDPAEIVGTYGKPIEEQHDMAAALQFEAWLNGPASDQPFFAMLGFMAPHTPLYPPREFDGRYSPDDIVPPDFDPAELHGKPAKQRWIYENRWAVYPEATRRAISAKYLDLCTYVDHCIERVISAVRDAGLLDDTIIVLFADHGEMLGSHGMIGKWFSLYEDALRVPLVIRLPGRRCAGRRLAQNVELLDVVPTLLDLLGQGVPADLPGRSLTPLLEHPTRPHRTAVFSMIETARMIRTGEWKLCIHAGRTSYGSFPRELFGDDEGELYDLRDDPGERVNLYHDPRCTAVRGDLARQLVEHEIRIQHDLGTHGHNAH